MFVQVTIWDIWTSRQMWITCCNISACCCCSNSWSCWGLKTWCWRICCICWGVMTCGVIIAIETGTCTQNHKRSKNAWVQQQSKRQFHETLPSKRTVKCEWCAHYRGPVSKSWSVSQTSPEELLKPVIKQAKAKAVWLMGDWRDQKKTQSHSNNCRLSMFGARHQTRHSSDKAAGHYTGVLSVFC